jgi:predicted porin
VPANFVAFDYGGYGTNGGGAIWFLEEGCTDCNGLTTNNVRYDSPTFPGFSVSASWGEDDFWDVAARYAGEHGGFKIAVAAAYSEATDESLVSCLGSGPNPCGLLAQGTDTEFFQIGGYAQHIASGLWVYGAYGQLESDKECPCSLAAVRQTPTRKECPCFPSI